MFCIVTCFSCTVTNFYHENNNVSSVLNLHKDDCEHVIVYQDKISVSVWNHDDLSVGSVYGIYNSNEVYGKWVQVEVDSTISLPMIGKIKAKGSTIYQLEQIITKALDSLIVNPIVQVRVLNKKAVVLGEVAQQGVFKLERDNLSIVELVALASPSEFADIKSIKLIRTILGVKKEYLLDFSKALEQNLGSICVKSGDIISVPKLPEKKILKSASIIGPIGGAITSIIILLEYLSK